MAYTEIDLLPARAFRARFGRLETLEGGGKGGGGSSSPSTPDYAPMAAASAQSAAMGKELGEKYLAENQRQYDLNTKVSQPIVEAQADAMGLQNAQGWDAYQRSTAVKPLETSMLNEVSGLSSADYQNLQKIKEYDLARSNMDWQDKHGKNLADAKKALESLTAERDSYLKGLKPAEAGSSGANGAGLTYNGRTLDPVMSRQQFDSMGGAGDASIGLSSTSYDDYLAQMMNIQQKARAEADAAGKSGSAAEQADPARMKDYSDRINALQDKLDTVSGQKFDPRTADTKLYDRIAAMDTQNGRAAKEALQQAERDNVLSLRDVARQEGLDKADRDTLMLGRGEAYLKDKANIDDSVGTAVADSRDGFTQAMGAVARNGMRYGMSPAALAAQASSLGLSEASKEAAAANNTRNAGVDDFRNRVANNYAARQNDFSRAVGLKGTVRNMKLQDDSTNWAKSLDMLSNARGVAGLSQGSYGLANQAGNSAVANQMLPSQAYMTNINAGNATQMQGQQQQIAGLSSVLNSQNSIYNTQMQANAAKSAGSGAMTGSLIGAGSSIAAAFI